jgi:hypothetical protein
MTREAIAAKAVRYLAEGRLVVELVDRGRIRARCRGGGAVYELEVAGGAWSCSCPARVRCAHLAALELVVAVAPADDPEPSLEEVEAA